MDEAIIAQYANAHKLFTEGLGLPSIDEENERLFSDEQFYDYRVPVTIVKSGYSTVRARDAKSAENVVKTCAALADGIDEPVQAEYVGPAVQI